MTMRAGWTYNGKRFVETFTTRMRAPRAMWFIDGHPVSYTVFRTEMKAAKAAEAAKAQARPKGWDAVDTASDT